MALRFSAHAALPQSAPQPTLPDVQKLGPQVGTRVPDFTLLDQKGQSRTLASLMGPKGLMLVFYRSADWCPYCKTQLAELQTRTADLARTASGSRPSATTPCPSSPTFRSAAALRSRCLSDPGSATIKRYGILNTTVPETNQQSYGIPFPGTFMLNTQGVVTSRFFEQAYQERSTVGSIMARLGNNARRAGDHPVISAAPPGVPDGARPSGVLEGTETRPAGPRSRADRRSESNACSSRRCRRRARSGVAQSAERLAVNQ